jgi:deazaflavin-dependent oxidoreductase (nitroreductase family)
MWDCRYRAGVDDRLVARLAATRTIEITTIGRRSGRPVRIEIWWFHFENRFIITGTPGRRGWLANLRAEPRMTVHTLGRDLPASVRLLTDRAFRRRFFTQQNAEVGWYLSQSPLDELVDKAPMIEVLLTP